AVGDCAPGGPPACVASTLWPLARGVTPEPRLRSRRAAFDDSRRARSGHARGGDRLRGGTAGGGATVSSVPAGGRGQKLPVSDHGDQRGAVGRAGRDATAV